MNRSKPKNMSEAIDELESRTDSDGSDLRSRLQAELGRFEETLKTIKPHLDEFSSKVSEKVSQTKEDVEHQVQKNPWAAIGVVGVIFFVLGFLLGWKNTRGRD
ncbi:MAG: YqjD family protein [Bdellovibrionales bacterium]